MECRNSVPTLTEAEKHQLLQWNQTGRSFSETLCLHACFEAEVERSADKTALVDAGKEFTYAELNQRANRLSHLFRAEGAGAGVPVGICLPRSAEFFVSALAVLKAGGICVPLDPAYPFERLRFMVEDSAAPLVVTRQELLPPGGLPTTHAIDASALDEMLLHHPESNPQSDIEPEGVAYILYTSGSTGKPKGVLLTHGGLTNYALSVREIYSVGAGDRILQFSTLSFDASLEEMFATFFGSATLVLRSPEMSHSIRAFLEGLRRDRITILDLPTAFWHEWVNQMTSTDDPVPHCLRVVVVGGEKASSSAFSTWTRHAPPHVRWLNSYGPTETSICATIYDPGSLPAKEPDAIVPIGRPVPNIRVHIVDPSFNLVPIGAPGEICISGIGVARGYLNRPDATREKFVPDPFSGIPGARLYKTGDIGRYLLDGNIEYLGRTDYQVKVRGFRIEPGEIEETLRAHPGVHEAVVIARTNASDTHLIAYITPAQDSPANVNTLRDYVKQRLPEYMVPSAFMVLDSMPLNENGKVDRRSLPEPAEEVLAVSVLKPANKLEKKLVELWEELLHVKPIGTDQNFFAMGGHSIIAARLMYRIEKTTGKRLPIATLLEAPTIEKLADLLQREEFEPRWSSLVPIQTSGAKQPLFCVHGVGGNVLGFRALGRYFDPERPFYGLQARGLNGIEPCHTRVEDMAADYLSEIRTVQPHGPYHIGGFSFGGLVAFEMAQQLLVQGEGVGLLALLDTYADKSDALLPLGRLLISPAKGEFLKASAVGLVRTLRWKRRWLSLPENIKRVHTSCSAAASRYRLRPYGGRITLICTRQTLVRAPEYNFAAWRQVAAGGVDVRVMEGNHGDMLGETLAETLAETLKKCLDSSSLIDNTVMVPATSAVPTYVSSRPNVA